MEAETGMMYLKMEGRGSTSLLQSVSAGPVQCYTGSCVAGQTYSEDLNMNRYWLNSPVGR